MKMIVLFFIVIGVIVFFDVVQTQRLIGVGRKLAAETVAFERMNKTADFQILVIGDSTAVGVGATKPEDSIAGRLGQDFPKASIMNKGISGLKVHQLVDGIEALHGEKYNLLVIDIGGNDIVRFTDLKEAKKDIERVLEKARELSPNVFLVTSGDVGTSQLLPFGTRWLFSSRTRRIREIFIAAAEKTGVHYVDIYGGHQKEGDPYRVSPKIYYAADMFHPSSEGYANWYSFIRRELTKAGLL